MLPLALSHKTNLILLALDDTRGIPETSDGRMEIIQRLVNLALNGGLTQDQLFIDPLVTAISTGTENAVIAFETIRKIKAAFPMVHITSGLSNISFGMPLRKIINRTFLSMCIGPFFAFISEEVAAFNLNNLKTMFHETFATRVYSPGL